MRPAVTYEIIEEYLKSVSETIRDNPTKNYDDTNFVDVPGVVKVVMKKRSKLGVKTTTTVMFVIAPDGTRISSFTVYKAKILYSGWKDGGLQGSIQPTAGLFSIRSGN